MSTRTLRLGALLLVGGLLMAACGTRVPDETFEQIVFGEGRPAGTAQQGEGDTGEDFDFDQDGDFSDFDPDAGGGDPAAPSGGPDAPGQPAAPGQPGQPDQPGGDDGGEAQEQQAQNTASDTGVTPTTIRVGNIVSRGGPLGPHQFGPMYFGANAYFELLNARGGVHGRRIQFTTCDDREEPAQNTRCAQQLVEQSEVFALVANATRTYAGARYVSENGVPDVGGYPIGNEYFRWPRFYAITGAPYTRDGNIGFNGKMYTNTAWQRWFVRDQGMEHAAVVHYNIPASAAFARFFRDGLRAEGAEVTVYEVNFLQPNFDPHVADMERRGVDMIWDTMDQTGNQNLCRSLENSGYVDTIKAKVSTAAAHGQLVGRYPAKCAATQHMVALTRNYGDTNHPTVREFQDTMRRLYGNQYMEEHLHQWALEGWMAAHWFTDAVRSMGANVTREGLAQWFEALEDYQADGMFAPSTRTFKPVNFEQQRTGRYCVGIVRWDNSSRSFRTVAPLDTCYDGHWVPWDPPQ